MLSAVFLYTVLQSSSDQNNPLYKRRQSVVLLPLALVCLLPHAPWRTCLKPGSIQGLCLDRMKIWILIYVCSYHLTLCLKIQKLFRFVADFRMILTHYDVIVSDRVLMVFVVLFVWQQVWFHPSKVMYCNPRAGVQQHRLRDI